MLSTYKEVNPEDVKLLPHELNKLKKIIRRYKRLGAFDHKQAKPIFIGAIVDLQLEDTEYWIGFR